MRAQFQIVYEDGRLVCRDAGQLSDERLAYLNSYLSKISGYRPIAFWKNSPIYSLYQTPLALPAGYRSLQMRLDRRFDGTRLPATATIAVNKACQCECTHCSAVDYNHSTKRELSFSDLSQAIRETVDLGATMIILLGGEPLLRRDLDEIVRCVPQDKASVILFTNGECLTLEKCERLRDAGLMGAFVSLDCSDPVRHDRFRKRQGLFGKAVNGLKNLKRAGLVAGISSYLSPQRLDESGFEEMMALGKTVGADEVTFFDAIPTGRWLHDDSCLLQPTHRAVIRQLVNRYRGKSEYPGISAQSTMTSECGSAFCFAANTQFYLSAAGEMCPCDFTPLTIGTFPDQTIKDLWSKLTVVSPYDRRSKSCRMQDQAFRKNVLLPIVERGGTAPYSLNDVPGQNVTRR